jgi:hypothetical protein
MPSSFALLADLRGSLNIRAFPSALKENQIIRDGLSCTVEIELTFAQLVHTGFSPSQRLICKTRAVNKFQL